MISGRRIRPPITQRGSSLSMQSLSNSTSSIPNNEPSSPNQKPLEKKTLHVYSSEPTPIITKKKKSYENSNEINNGETNIQVVVRCRGRSKREIRENSCSIVSTEGPRGREVCVQTSPLSQMNTRTYTFDRVFGPEADQAMIFDDVVLPILREVLDGYNCTIFAYGQTGTGKTYTMTGDMSNNYGVLSDTSGIIPRTLYRLFSILETENTEYSVKCSFIELYNEELRDLLSIEDKKVKIFEDTVKKGIVISGMEDIPITNSSDGINLLQMGSHKRQVAATKCNDLSSRSHSIFTITMHIKDTTEFGEDLLRVGKLNLVDLAGSENIGRSGAENKRAREAGMINQSLLTLGRVINSLVDKSQHIPYRESKLTRLLQDSLGGKTKTCIIATISPEKINLEETISTLEYANRAKSIKNKPQVNQMMTKKTLIKEYIQDIERLKNDLNACRQKSGIYLAESSYKELTEENQSNKALVEEQQRKIDALESSLKSTREQFEQNMKLFIQTKKDLEKTSKTLEDTKNALRKTEVDLVDTKQHLDEEIVLRKAHQTTEWELDIIANELHSTLKKTIVDINSLHEKIERKTDIESSNKILWDETKSHITRFMEDLDNNITKYHLFQFQYSNKLENEITEFVTKEVEHIDDNFQFIDQQLLNFENRHAEISNEISTAKYETNNFLEEIKKLKEKIKLGIKDGFKNLNKATEKISGEVFGEMIKFQQQIHNSYSQLGHDMKSVFDDTEKHITIQTTEIQNLKSEILGLSQSIKNKIFQISDHFKKSLSQEQKKNSEEKMELLTHISSLINSFFEKQNERQTAQIDYAQSSVDDISTNIDELASTFSRKIDIWSAKEGLFVKKLMNSKEDIKNNVILSAKNSDGKGAAIQGNTQTIYSEILQLIDAQIQDVNTQIQTFDNIIAKAHSQNSVHYDAYIQNNDSVFDDIKNSYQKLKTKVNDIKKDIDVHSYFVNDLTKNQKSENDFHKDSIISQITVTHNKILSTSIKNEILTGKTPKKCNYEYPASWKLTKPHEEILKQLRKVPLSEIDTNIVSVENPKYLEFKELENNTVEEKSSSLYVEINSNSGEKLCNTNAKPSTNVESYEDEFKSKIRKRTYQMV
ncbi:hypothetical protein PNEG_00515 [Pneumocystis murina B123]|uniref:Kinesin motor domain-containing protein n=1 Tax=Pneumocystis murina (strain B123) TaxID=1069680 RepID=M7NW16_PNEMU|nr:hypothetical protein PNEG_00515 [Pneumocystis murina B123]EMR11502.1 hypothetical protein PNEG_00515 [Pneumocystis murina B123]